MSDVFAIFGSLLMLAIVFPGLLTACWLLFPRKVERARARAAGSPGRSLVVGLAVAALIAIPTIALFSLPAEAGTLLALLLLAGALAFATVGAAGIAAEMGRRLQERTEGDLSETGGFIRGAVTLELAAAFPIIGWFIVIPVATLVALGATVRAFRGGRAKTAPATSAELSPSQI